MACGHVSNATYDDKPVCAICYGICDGAEVAVYECVGNEGLQGRKAKCRYCSNIVDSNWDLAFFEYRPEDDCDIHYNGCRGWD